MNDWNTEYPGESEPESAPLDSGEAVRIRRRLMVVAASLGCITTTTVVAGWGIQIGADDARRAHSILATQDSGHISPAFDSPMAVDSALIIALSVDLAPEPALPTRSELVAQSEQAMSALRRAAERRAVLAAAGLDAN